MLALTGTRSAVDVCELPSQLMEYWVRDPATLRQLARHHRTGELMPAGLARGAVAGLTMFKALDLQQQVRCRCCAGQSPCFSLYAMPRQWESCMKSAFDGVLTADHKAAEQEGYAASRRPCMRWSIRSCTGRTRAAGRTPRRPSRS